MTAKETPPASIPPVWIPPVLIEKSAIERRVAALGADIERDHPNAERDLVVVPVLKGSFVFAADLIRAIHRPLSVDFFGCRSYAGTESTGVVETTLDLTQAIEGKDVVVVEDIVDSGLTMAYILANFATRRPHSLKVASLLRKPARTRVAVSLDYIGFDIEDVFVVGYGLDVDERYRNLPYLGVMPAH